MRLLFPILMILGSVGLLFTYQASTSVVCDAVLASVSVERPESVEIELPDGEDRPTFNFQKAASRAKYYFFSTFIFLVGCVGLQISRALAPRVSIFNLYSILGGVGLLLGSAANYKGVRDVIMGMDKLKKGPPPDHHEVLAAAYESFGTQQIGCLALLLSSGVFLLAAIKCGRIDDLNKPARVLSYFSVATSVLSLALMFWGYCFIKPIEAANLKRVMPSELFSTLSFYQMGVITSFGLLFVTALISFVGYAQMSRGSSEVNEGD